MRNVRAVIKVPALFLFTALFYLTYAVLLVFVKVFRIRFELLRNAAMAFWSRGASIILNIRIKKIGDAPKAPFILVLNHLSYLDIIPVFLYTDCTFVAKKEVKSWPLLGKMIASMGVIFVDRGRKRDVVRVNHLLSKNLNNKQGIVLFPEGTSSGGKQVLPFRSPLLEFPASQTLPVHAASIKYETTAADEPAEESVCFFGKRDPFLKHIIKMAKNKKIYCTIRFGEQPVHDQDRKKLAARLHEEVSVIFEPTDSERFVAMG